MAGDDASKDKANDQFAATAYAQSVADVLAHYSVTEAQGLSSAQVSSARSVYGRNELPPNDPTPFWKLVLKQFDDLLVKILLAAAFISFALAWMDEADQHWATAFLEPMVIFAILIANATVGVLQETNAEKAIEALKSYEAEKASVIRNGKAESIDAADLVPGDVVEVTVGNLIPADIRVTKVLSSTIRTDQALLTGESVSVIKQEEPVPGGKVVNQDKKNILFSGTTVSIGKARGVVVLTGPRTEMGKIHQTMVETEDVETPLKKKLDEFGELLSKVIAVICVLVWLVNFHHFSDPSHGSWVRGAIYYFKIAVALAVAAIPEGLPAVVTTCLALGTAKMARRNAIVRSLPSVETLGCCTVICSDKTGTLTTNKMLVTRVLTVAADKTLAEHTVDGNGWSPHGTVTPPAKTAPGSALAWVAAVSSLCNDSVIVYDEAKKEFNRIGEATEAALRVLVEKLGVPDDARQRAIDAAAAAGNHAQRVQACNAFWEAKEGGSGGGKSQGKYTKTATFEFTRDRKSMSVVVEESGTGARVLLVKGAPEAILERCVRYVSSSGEEAPLTDALRKEIQKKIMLYGTGEHTLRCIGMAYRRDPVVPKNVSDTGVFQKIEQELVFAGAVGMLDPPREEVKASIATCKQAGIRVIVITGDNKDTAEAICRRIGVFGENEDVTGKSYTGKEFDALTPAEQEKACRRASLFSRTEPAHKMRLVEILQSQGEVCAMTGDGVNDAPALKKADIGVAMGSGTAVAKHASAMVLADDNFATIVSAVEEGRAIFNNTKQFIRYLISSNIGEVVCIFLTAITGMPEALIPVQLLWVNLVTDGLPATALGFNPPEADIMRKKPRGTKDAIVNGWLFFRYLIVGVYVGLATVGGFVWWFTQYQSGPQLTWSQLVSFSTCDDKAAAWQGVFSNGFACSVFENTRPSTVSLSILVTVEMFNAMNSVSENTSIFVMSPFQNVYLLAAIAGSFALHFMLLYVPFFANAFSVSPINADEWMAVLALSAPVIVVDEVLKLVSKALHL